MAKFFINLGFLLLSIVLMDCRKPQAATDAAENALPNIVFILVDDMGYADIGTFGAIAGQTPHLDQMAREGLRLTDFYASPSCSPSRASLMTGSYPARVGIPWVLGPAGPVWTKGRSDVGLNPAEETLPELLQKRGYVTGMVGKWHLGHHRAHLPTQHGFDEFFGLPYSNDMWPVNSSNYGPLPVLDGQEVTDTVSTLEDQGNLTRLFTQKALAFLQRHQRKPFFLYLAHPMPHVPIYASEAFRGKSPLGLYGDVVQEIDWSVGEILRELKRLGLDENTLVVFTSDNGPWLTFGNHAGSAKPFSEGKASVFEGGVRVPFLARWPAKIPAGTTSSAVTGLMDVLPTLADLTGAELPRLPIDGKSMRAVLLQPQVADSPREVHLYFQDGELQAIRKGKWKLHTSHIYPAVITEGKDGNQGIAQTKRIEQSLFDLIKDPGEILNVAPDHPAVVAELSTLLAEHAAEMLANKRTAHRVGE